MDKWHNVPGHTSGRDHTLGGVHVRQAAQAGLINAQIGMNRQFGRTNRAFAGLIDWRAPAL